MNAIKWIALGTAGLALGMAAGASANAEVVVVVSAHSTVTTLSPRQVSDIFLGRTNRFPDGAQAVPLDQAEGSPTRDEFYAKVLGQSAPQIKAHWSKIIFTGRGQPPRAFANAADTKKAIAGDPNAIGYIEKDAIDNSVKILSIQ